MNCSKIRLEEESLYYCDGNSRDSGFSDVLTDPLDGSDLEEFGEINFTNLPTDFKNLLHKPIDADTVSPVKKKMCHRSDSDSDSSDDFVIKSRSVAPKSSSSEDEPEISSLSLNSKPFQSSQETIKMAVQRSFSEEDLIADFSRQHLLPLVPSRHPDLKAIETATLRRLLDGDFSKEVASFKIIDCRYPYEYEGGHISGAVNIYTHEECSSLLSSSEENKPTVLIFHCEFSSERGPNLYRHLRQEDRKKNIHSYPSLCFPEMYILEGGYKKFFEEYSNLCLPSSYVHMLDENFSREMQTYRKISKTWNSDVKSSSRKHKNSRKFRS